MNERQVENLVEAAQAVIATVFGNTEGLTLENHLEAVRLAASSLEAELVNCKSCSTGEIA